MAERESLGQQITRILTNVLSQDSIQKQLNSAVQDDAWDDCGERGELRIIPAPHRSLGSEVINHH